MQNKTSFSQRAVLLVFGLPILLMVLLPIGGLIGNIHPGTLVQYLGDDLTQKALRLSGLSSFISTGLILLFGTPLALLIARSKSPRFLSGLLNFTLLVPPAVAGLGLLTLLGQHGFLGEWLQRAGIQIPLALPAVILAQTFVACPYFIKSAAASFRSVPVHLKEMIILEGGSSLQVFRFATLPHVWRGFLAGTAMAWARGLGEFGATLIFAGNTPGKTQTLPLAIFSNYAENGERALVVAMVLLVIALGVLLVIQWLKPREVENPI